MERLDKILKKSIIDNNLFRGEMVDSPSGDFNYRGLKYRGLTGLFDGLVVGSGCFLASMYSGENPQSSAAVGFMGGIIGFLYGLMFTEVLTKDE